MRGSVEAYSVARTMQAIELLSFQPASAPQVADALRVHPGTSRRLLNRLVSEGWLIRTGSFRHVYVPTMRIAAMAAQLVSRDPLAVAALPLVSALHAETGAAAHLCIPSYRSVLCLVHRAGGPDARPQLRELVPAHATAAGKVLMAYRDHWRASVLARPLDPLTHRTVVDPARVEAEAELTRERGFALEDEELEPGLRGVAVPIRGKDGTMLASLALTAPAPQLPDEAVGEIVALLKHRATALHQSTSSGER